MRDRILSRLAAWHSEYPRRMLAVSLLITGAAAVFAARLSVTMRTSDLLPRNDPRVQIFNRIIDEFNTATSLVVVAQGEEAAIKAFADELAPRILALRDSEHNDSIRREISKLDEKRIRLAARGGNRKRLAKLEERIGELRREIDRVLFQRVDYKNETEFLRDHMLMLIKEEDLRTSRGMFFDPNLSGLLANLNDSMEAEYVGREEALSTREQEDGAFALLDGIESLALALRDTARGNEPDRERLRAVSDKLLFGEPYMLSYDKSTLVMFAVPDFTMMDRDLLMSGTEKVQKLLDDMLPGFPGVTAGLSGDIAREHDEQVYSEKSLSTTTVIAMAAILILLVISFRMWAAPIFAVLNLAVGLVWAMGVSYLAVGRLNMMTAMMSVILLGLGIDFSIHLISVFTERRAAGEDVGAALRAAFLKSGRGVITGALTTACAFLTLLISSTRGMREMGIVAGLGLLCILLAAFLFLPVLLVLRERRADRRSPERPQRDITFVFLGRMSESLGRHWRATLAASLAATLVLLAIGIRIRFDHNFMNIEPKGLTSIELMDTVLEKFDLSMQYALVLTEGPDESRELAEAYRKEGTVAQTDDISFYLPSPDQQARRIPYIEEVRRRMDAALPGRDITLEEEAALAGEIERLEMNVMEIQDMAFLGGQDKVDTKCRRLVGDPEDSGGPTLMGDLIELMENRRNSPDLRQGLTRFQGEFSPHFREAVLRMCSLDPIRLRDLPNSVLDRYADRDRNLFLVTVYPRGNPFSDTRYLNRFVDDLERVSQKATGIPPMSLALTRILSRDGRNAMLLTLGIVFLLLWVDYRKVGYALAAMVPLACGVAWMFGLMHAWGMKLSMVSVMGLPLIIGIGIDDGVHIVHRRLSEGRGRIRVVFSSTGKAILLTTLTTMLAFGSLVFSIFPGWVQFGLLLFIGVGACFLATVLILPGILGFWEKKARPSEAADLK